MKSFFRKNRIDSDGFTIVETLVAVTIMMISIIGPLTIAQKSLLAAVYAKDQVIASFLAQDLMENVINIIDTKKIDDASFTVDTWLTDNSEDYRWCHNESYHCPLHTQSSYPQLNGVYTIYGSPNPQTRFSRKVNLTMVSDNEALIKVSVRWTNGTVENTAIVESHIFNDNL